MSNVQSKLKNSKTVEEEPANSERFDLLHMFCFDDTNVFEGELAYRQFSSSSKDGTGETNKKRKKIQKLILKK